MLDYGLTGKAGHLYTAASIGTKFRGGTFTSRLAAEKSMRDFIGRNGIRIRETWKDGHYVTYVCDGGIRFFIGRM